MKINFGAALAPHDTSVMSQRPAIIRKDAKALREGPDPPDRHARGPLAGKVAIRWLPTMGEPCNSTFLELSRRITPVGGSLSDPALGEFTSSPRSAGTLG